MKKLIVFLASTFTICALFAANITIDWCPNTEANLVGYKVYYVETNKVVGWKPEIYDNITNCPPLVLTNGSNWVRNYNVEIITSPSVTSAVISNLFVGKTYYFAIAAFNDEKESPLSAEIEVSITNKTPSQPQNFRILDVR